MEEDENKYCALYIVRHGESVGNVQKIVQGHIGSDLTETGVRQALNLQKKFQKVHFDAVFSSDLHRAKRTAELIILEKKLAVQTSKLLRERSYGRFEGKKSEEYHSAVHAFLEEMEKLNDEKKWSFRLDPSIENDEEVVSRFITILREISLSHIGKTVLVVSHGGCIRTLLIRLGYARRSELPGGSFLNAGYVRVLSDGIDFIVQEALGVKKIKIS